MPDILFDPRSQERPGKLATVEDEFVKGRVKVPIFYHDVVTLVSGEESGLAQQFADERCARAARPAPDAHRPNSGRPVAPPSTR